MGATNSVLVRSVKAEKREAGSPSQFHFNKRRQAKNRLFFVDFTG